MRGHNSAPHVVPSSFVPPQTIVLVTKMLGLIFQPQLAQNFGRFVTKEEQHGHGFDVTSSSIWTFPPQYDRTL